MVLNELPIKSTLLKRDLFFEMIITVVMLSIGVNLIIFSINNLKIFNNGLSLYFGIFITLISLLILGCLKIGKLHKKLNLEGFIIYDSKKNKIVDAPFYSLSEKLISDLKGAFKENNKIKSIWNSNSLKKILYKRENNSEEISTAKEIINEAVEYIILKNLSITLTDYFDRSNFKKNKIEEFTRNSIPKILLTNRFLEIFSRPMNERPIFIKNNKKEDFDKNIIVSYIDGYKFEKFSLALPKGSKINRPNKNTIIIDAPLIKIVIKTLFEGYGDVLPRDFNELYLGLNFNPMRYHEYIIPIRVSIKNKMLGLLSINGWKYYQWVDLFLNSLYHEISKQSFLKKIAWNSARTVYQISKNIKFLKDVKVKINKTEEYKRY